MRNTIKEFLFINKRYITAIPYIIVALVVFVKRTTLIYFYIPYIQNMHTVTKVLDILLVFMLLFGVIFVVKTLRAPWWSRKKFQRAMRQAGLKNGENQYPSLLEIRPDISEKHKRILRVDGVGLSIDDFKKKVGRIDNGLKIKITIDEIEVDKHSNILLPNIPRKHYKPMPISLDYKEITEEPNILLLGKTGSGKSYALSIIAGIYARIPNVSIVICDYKKSTFAHFDDTPNFFGYNEVSRGIQRVYDEFNERIKANDKERNKRICVLMIDEYGAYISALDSKIAKEQKRMIGEMLLMGRSLGIVICIATQYGSAEIFQAGARYQFRQILALGNLTEVEKEMIFPTYKQYLTDNNGCGHGYFLREGKLP